MPVLGSFVLRWRSFLENKDEHVLKVDCWDVNKKGVWRHLDLECGVPRNRMCSSVKPKATLVILYPRRNL